MWWLAATIVSYGAADLLSNRPDILTLTLLLMAPAFDTLIRGLVPHLMPKMHGSGEVAEDAWAATKSAYKRIGRVLVFGIVLVVIAGSWGLTREFLASAGAAGASARQHSPKRVLRMGPFFRKDPSAPRMK